MQTSPPFVDSRGRAYWGWLFLIIGLLSCLSFFYAAVVSKLMPSSDNTFSAAIQNDWFVGSAWAFMIYGWGYCINTEFFLAATLAFLSWIGE